MSNKLESSNYPPSLREAKQTEPIIVFHLVLNMTMNDEYVLLENILGE